MFNRTFRQQFDAMMQEFGASATYRICTLILGMEPWEFRFWVGHRSLT